MSRSSKKNSTEIRKLLQSLNDDNYDSLVHELSQYIENGTAESILLVESCLRHFKIYEKKDLRSMHLEPAIASLFRKLMEKPHFCEVFSSLVQHISINEVFLKDLSSGLQLSPFEKLGFGLALSESKNKNVRMAGRNFCIVQLEELCQLAERGHEASVRSLLKYPLQHCPETLLLGMAHVINLIQHEVSLAVLPVLLKDTSMSGLVLQLWHVNPLLFSRALNATLNLNPQNMTRIVDLFQELEVDLLPKMSLTPCIDPEFDAALKANKMKRKVDEYLKTRPENSSFLFELKHKLLLSSSEVERSRTCYNVPLVNSLVLYVGTKAIQKLHASTVSDSNPIAKFVSKISYFAGAALDIFQTLKLDLDSEGCYLFFNAVTDQLRYPSNHTHFFSFVMLLFFRDMKDESIQEQITRVLLERLITKLPHPWGVQVTFIELVKNPGYNFWNLNFTRCDPEIKRVFDSVSATTGITSTRRSCSWSALKPASDMLVRIVCVILIYVDSLDRFITKIELYWTILDFISILSIPINK